MQRGAIILCGGQSSRMGRDKATLPFGPEFMLQRVVRLVGESVDFGNVVVVGAPTQTLPGLPADVQLLRDSHQFQGPLQGLANGLAALQDRVDSAYVTACDVPLLAPAFIDHMFDLLADFDIAFPFDGQHHHVLAAVYRTSVLPAVVRLRSTGQAALHALIAEVRSLEVPVEELRAVDAGLGSLHNMNTPQEYESALRAAGIAAR